MLLWLISWLRIRSLEDRQLGLVPTTLALHNLALIINVPTVTINRLVTLLF